MEKHLYFGLSIVCLLTGLLMLVYILYGEHKNELNPHNDAVMVFLITISLYFYEVSKGD